MQRLFIVLFAGALLHAAGGVPVAVDPQGHLWQVGSTASAFFAATPGVVQPKITGESDVYLIRYNREGTAVEAATYLGGKLNDSVGAIAFDENGNVYLRGMSASEDFLGGTILRPNGPSTGLPPSNPFLAKLDRDLRRVEYVFNLGVTNGTYYGLAAGADGSVFTMQVGCGVRGGFCSAEAYRVGPEGKGRVWTRAIATDAGYSADLTLSLDGRSVWVVNSRGATRLRSEDGAQEIGVDFMMRFTPGNAGFVAARRDGGVVFGLTETVEGAVVGSVSGDGVVGGFRAVGNTISGYARDMDGVVHFTGNGRFGLPISEKALARCASAGSDAYLVGWDVEKNEPRYGTYLPDVMGAFAVRDGELVFLNGTAFARLRPEEFPVSAACLTAPVINFASATPRRLTPDLYAVAPGEFVDVYGSGIGPAVAVTIAMDGTRSAAPREIGGVRLLFNGIAAALIGAGPDRLTAQVPYAVGESGKVAIQVEKGGALVDGSIEMDLVPAMPAAISDHRPGSYVQVVRNADWSLNGYTNRAKAGDTITVFVSGGGRLNGVEDDAAAVVSPVPVAVNRVSASLVGAGSQEVTFAGGVPGQLPGLLQVNVLLAPGLQIHGEAGLELLIGDRRVFALFYLE
jgi:uncharacterized protein (TIGR03437 family)